MCEVFGASLANINLCFNLVNMCENPECLELLYIYGRCRYFPFNNARTPELLAMAIKCGGYSTDLSKYINDPAFMKVILANDITKNQLKRIIHTILNPECIKLIFENGLELTDLDDQLRINPTYARIGIRGIDAVKTGDLNTVKALGKYNFKFRDNNDHDALYYAVSCDYVSIVSYLLQEGLDPEECYETKIGIESPMSLAIDNESKSIIKLLCDKNPNIVDGGVYSIDDKGYNALEYTIIRKNYNMMKFIIKCGAKLLDVDDNYDIMDTIYSIDEEIQKRMLAYIKPLYDKARLEAGVSDNQND